MWTSHRAIRGHCPVLYHLPRPRRVWCHHLRSCPSNSCIKSPLTVLFAWPQPWKTPGLSVPSLGPRYALGPEQKALLLSGLRPSTCTTIPELPAELQAEVSLPCRQLGRVIDLFDMDWGHSQSRPQQRKIHISVFFEIRKGKHSLWCVTSVP